jgi:hypothetical protein
MVVSHPYRPEIRTPYLRNITFLQCARNIDADETFRNRIVSLLKVQTLTVALILDSVAVSDASRPIALAQIWKMALRILIGAHSAAEMAERACAFGLNRATLYRWVANFPQTGLLSSLLALKPGGSGLSRLNVAQERATRRAIDQVYLTQRLPLKL